MFFFWVPCSGFRQTAHPWRAKDIHNSHKHTLHTWKEEEVTSSFQLILSRCPLRLSLLVRGSHGHDAFGPNNNIVIYIAHLQISVLVGCTIFFVLFNEGILLTKIIKKKLKVCSPTFVSDKN
jgi:hypothetical protein